MDAKRGLIGAALTGVVVTAGLTTVAGANAATATATTEVKSVYASDDTYTSSTRTKANFGSSDKLVVGREDGETRVSYVKFATGALPAGATVTGAELRLPLESKPVEADLSVYPVAAGWTEKALTALTAPLLPTAAVTIRPKATDTTLSVDVSKLVTKPGTYAFALRSAATGAVTRLRSLEYGDDATGGPELRLTIKPKATIPTPTKTTPSPSSPSSPSPTAPAPSSPTPSSSAPSSPAPTSPTPTSPTPTSSVPTSPTPTSSAPSSPAPGSTVPPAAGCVTDALLVPSCGVLWGAAAGGFTDAPRDQALKDWEALTGRTAAIFHAYHKGDEMFPTKAEIAMTRDPAKPRVLLLNWKVAYNSTWAKVAAGNQDARIDAWAAYVKANYSDQKFYLALHHEPENDINATPGSGMTAKDFAAMYRHVIERLRTDGMTNMVNVLAYMGNEKWMAQSWWKDLYPGDDVVDWIGLDSYVSVEPGYYHFGDFGNLLDRRPTTGGAGFYEWSVQTHPTKPIMVAEWGMYHRLAFPTDKAAAFTTVLPELKTHPAVKAIVYFDTAADNEGDRNIAVNSTPASLTAFKKLAADPTFNVKITQ